MPLRSSTTNRTAGIGDRVRFRDACVPVQGVIVDELTESYVLVKWDGVTAPTPHAREDLQIDTNAQPSAQ